MKYFYLILVIFTINISSLFAQNEQCELSGKVTDEADHSIIAATILVKKSITGDIVVSTTTNSKGQFSMKISLPGEYSLEVRSIGYKSVTEKIQIKQPFIIKNFILKEETIELGEVVVMARFSKLERNGNTKVRFKGNPIIKGKSMSEALRYVQGVEVNGNSLLINGKSETVIYLGDRVITPEQLYAIPPSMIESLEVVPNPGVSYGKVSNQGAVLIVHLRKEEGIIGSVTLPIQADVNGLVDVVPNISFQYQHGKFTLYNTLQGGYGNYRINYDYKDAYENSDKIAKSWAEMRTKESILTDDLGMQYRFSKDHQLSVFGGVSFDRTKVKQTNEKELTKSLLEQKADNTMFGLSGGVGYQGKFKLAEGATLSGVLSYSHSRSNVENTYRYQTQTESDMTGRMSYLAFNPKFSIKFKGNQALSAGLRCNYGENQNKADGIQSDVLSQLIKREYRLRGYDFSPYAEYSKYFKKVYLQVGLSYQATKVMYADLLDRAKDYNIMNRGLYPNVMMQYLLNQEKNSALQFGYRHFFSLPNYGYYSPLATYSRENFYSIGNHKLKQEVFDEAELIYYVNRDLNFTYRILNGRDLIQLMTYEDKSRPNLFFSKPENVGTRWQHYLAGAYKKWLFPFWYINTTLFVRHESENMTDRSVKSFYVGGSTVHQFVIKKRYGLSLLFNGQTAHERLAYKTGAQYALDLGFYTTFLKDRLQLSVSLANLVHSQNELIVKSSGNTLTRIDVSPLTRLKLSISYTFSKGSKVKRVRTHEATKMTLEKPII